MPDDVALEKVNALRCLGATVERVRPASIVDTKHVRPLTGGLASVLKTVSFLASVCGTSVSRSRARTELIIIGYNRTSHANMLRTLANTVRKIRSATIQSRT